MTAQPPVLDVAVVGGGIAGSTAAAHLAGAGLDVALMHDASTSPPDFDVLLTASAVRVLRETPGLQLAAHCAVDSIALHVAGRPARTIPEVGGFSISRRHLSDALFFAAMNVGSRLRADTVVRLQHHADYVELRTEERRTPLRARHLVIATGSRGIGMFAPDQDTEALRTMVACAARYPIAGERAPTEMLQLFVPPDASALRTLALSVWVLPGEPNGEVTVRVVASSNDVLEPKDIMRRGVEALAAEVPGLALGERIGRIGHGSLDADFSRERLLSAAGILIGDAAGLVNPFTGEGLSYAVESALIASRTIQAHANDPDAARQSYARRLEHAFVGEIEVSRRAERRDHLAWRFLSDAAESDHPFLAKGRRGILLPEGLTGVADPLLAPLQDESRALVGPFLIACDEVMLSVVRDDWPFLARMALAGGDDEERLRPAMLMFGAMLAAGGTVDPREAVLGGGLELAMLGAMAFLGAAPDDRQERGVDWAQTGIVVGGDFLLAQAARLIARSGAEVSWSFSQWLADLAILRAQRLQHVASVDAAATSAALYEFPLRLGAELAGADDETVGILRSFGAECGRMFLHTDEVLGLTGRRTRLDTTVQFMAANRMASDGIEAGGDNLLDEARSAVSAAEQRGIDELNKLPESNGTRLLASFLSDIGRPAWVE